VPSENGFTSPSKIISPLTSGNPEGIGPFIKKHNAIIMHFKRITDIIYHGQRS
jgi:hypothetical protein